VEPAAGAGGGPGPEEPSTVGDFAWVDANGDVVEGLLPHAPSAAGIVTYVDPETQLLWTVRIRTAEVGWWPNFAEPYFNLARLFKSSDCSGAPRVWANFDGAPTNVAVGVWGIPGGFIPPAQPSPDPAGICSHASGAGTECIPHAPCYTTLGPTIAASDLVPIAPPALGAVAPLTLHYFP
jgi:hypothetical protein